MDRWVIIIVDSHGFPRRTYGPLSERPNALERMSEYVSGNGERAIVYPLISTREEDGS